jgi:hypothetical protein
MYGVRRIRTLQYQVLEYFRIPDPFGIGTGLELEM